MRFLSFGIFLLVSWLFHFLLGFFGFRCFLFVRTSFLICLFLFVFHLGFCLGLVRFHWVLILFVLRFGLDWLLSNVFLRFFFVFLWGINGLVFFTCLSILCSLSHLVSMLNVLLLLGSGGLLDELLFFFLFPEEDIEEGRILLGQNVRNNERELVSTVVAVFL